MTTNANIFIRAVLGAGAITLAAGLGGCASHGETYRHPRAGVATEIDYYYYPSTDIYFDIRGGSYWRREQSHWRRVTTLPAHFRPHDHDRVLMRLDHDRYERDRDDRRRAYASPGSGRERGPGVSPSHGSNRQADNRGAQARHRPKPPPGQARVPSRQVEGTTASNTKTRRGSGQKAVAPPRNNGAGSREPTAKADTHQRSAHKNVEVDRPGQGQSQQPDIRGRAPHPRNTDRADAQRGRVHNGNRSEIAGRHDRDNDRTAATIPPR